MKQIYKIITAAAAAACLLCGCRDKGPSELELAREKGISYMEQADYANAAAAFEEAYALCDEKMPKTKADISLYEAACQMKTENYEEVKNTCSRILEMTENADAYYMRGAAFLNLDETDAAKADFDCAVALNPADYELFLNIYREYEKKNLSAVGDQYLQQALNIEGGEMEDYYQKGCIYFYLKDYTKAQEMLIQPVEEKHKRAMMLMGEVYLELEDSVHARNVYQQYMEEYGDDAQAYNGIVLCELADGNYDAAVSAAETGLGLEGDESTNRDLLYNEIVACERKLDFEAAKQAAARFVELYPDDEKGKKEYDFLSTR